MKGGKIMNKNQAEKESLLQIFKITKDQWPFILKLVAIAVIGIAILNFANVMNSPESTTTNNLIPDTGENSFINEGEGVVVTDNHSLEKRLEDVISKMDGVEKATVSIVYAEGSTREYAINVSTTEKFIEEKDQVGGIRTTNEQTESGQMVMVQGNSEPVLVKESMPKIQGVLVVAKGVENPVVKERVFKAVQTLLQIPAHRITISSRNGG
jgi:stage III sporulation protein AG